MINAQVFGEKHLLGTGFLLMIVVIFLWLLKPAKTQVVRQQRFYLFLFTGLFLLIEFLRLYFLIRRDGGLALYQLPLNLCSVPLSLYPLLSLDRKRGNLTKWLMPSAFATVMLAGVIALLIPTNILGVEVSWFPLASNYVEISSFTYHALMIAAPLALIKIGFYKPKLKDMFYAFGFTGGFAAIAMIVNAYTNQDFLLLNYGTGSPFQFLIAQSKLLYQGVMIGLGAFLISLFFLVAQLLSKKTSTVSTSQSQNVFTTAIK
jgi:hypothetical protein